MAHIDIPVYWVKQHIQTTNFILPALAESRKTFKEWLDGKDLAERQQSSWEKLDRWKTQRKSIKHFKTIIKTKKKIYSILWETNNIKKIADQINLAKSIEYAMKCG